MQTFLSNLPVALATALAWALLAFATSKIVHRHAVIDVFWGAGFLVVYAESYFAAPASTRANHSALHVALFVALAVWSLRLSGYLAYRQRGQGEDSRYVAILKAAKGKSENFKALKMIYGLQGLLLWFVSIPLQFAAYSQHLVTSVPALVGLAIVGVGVFFEGVGDDQLRRFVKDEANHGKTMNRGLWRYTRHPNYFGDAVVWLGLFLVTCSYRWGFLTILSPVVMWYLLTRVSGKPMLERKLKKTREGYAEYIAATSSFFPRPPKKLTK